MPMRLVFANGELSLINVEDIMIDAHFRRAVACKIMIDFRALCTQWSDKLINWVTFRQVPSWGDNLVGVFRLWFHLHWVRAMIIGSCSWWSNWIAVRKEKLSHMHQEQRGCKLELTNRCCSIPCWLYSYLHPVSSLALSSYVYVCLCVGIRTGSISLIG